MGRNKENYKKYQREWVARRRAEWFKINGPCVFCGSDKELELDHIDPTNKISHNIWSWSKERRDKEAAKCRVLCRICHVILHAEQRKREPEHGRKRYAHKNFNCRCEICVQEMREYWKNGHRRRRFKVKNADVV